jgi:nicotinamide mononucleotide (NMN) deamidase PncC
MNNFKEIVSILNDRNETIATMESCTGGGVANQITNIEGASNVLKFSAVTYSNEYMIKMGVAVK